MATLTAGSVVLVPFPFSDLTGAKLRPAIVLADAGRDDWIMCQITSRAYGDDRAYRLDPADFSSGGLRIESYARPLKLFTGNKRIISAVVGNLQRNSYSTIITVILEVLQQM